MDNETREHLRRMLQHASIAGRAHAFDRLAVDLQALLDASTETRPAPAVEEVATVEAAPVVEEVAPVKPAPKRKTRTRRRAKGTAVEQPTIEEAAPVVEEAAPAPKRKRKRRAVRPADAPAAVESALGTVDADASGTLADLFPSDEQEAGA